MMTLWNVHHMYSVEGDHVYSFWNITSGTPIDKCYTEMLYDVTMQNINKDTTILIQGLGGAVLPARLALKNISSTVIEISQSVHATYINEFKNIIEEWSPNIEEHMTIKIEDALHFFPNHYDVIVSDIPDCYRDVSHGCITMIRKFIHMRKKIIANVWTRNKNRFVALLGGEIIADNGQGVSVWLS